MIVHLDEIKSRLWSKHKKGPTSQIRREYQDLHRSADHIRLDIGN